MKVCSTCKVELENPAFAKDRSKPDGLQSSCRACRSQYMRDNKRRINRLRRRYLTKRRANDPLFALLEVYRRRINHALDGRLKEESSRELLGCSVAEFKEHLAKGFTKGMRWGLRGSFQVDHILPVSAFDMDKPKHVKYCFHWSNHQVLTPEANLRKSDKYCPKHLKKYLASALIPYSSQKKDEKR